MPNKKKQQIIDEPDVTPYNIETVLKRGTIVVKAIVGEEWALSYDANQGLYSALQITSEGKKARRCSGKSLTEVLIFSASPAVTENILKVSVMVRINKSLDGNNLNRTQGRQ